MIFQQTVLQMHEENPVFLRAPLLLLFELVTSKVLSKCDIKKKKKANL